MSQDRRRRWQNQASAQQPQVVPPLGTDYTPTLRVIAWQDWQVSRARLRTQYQESWDGDGSAPDYRYLVVPLRALTSA